ncbi:MAG: hypothetical protein CMP49_02270 [Flavobacteriales bacterium]|nr:hypothetical protein [Flavobacteriales bacterium]|tara:strand:+ start:10715 stop:11713 length:999 start_codon:yes stop_codon:yes gene_type:complete
MKDSQYDFFWLLKIISKYFRLLCFVAFITIIISSLISLFLIEEKFQSSVIIYPTTTNSVSQALLVEHNPYRKDVLEFGEEEQAEQLLQVLNSDEIRDSIVNRFNLFEHYKISPNDPYYRTIMKDLYSKAVKIKKTKFNSIEISVLDKNPQLAANIANEYLILIDFVIARIREARAQQALQVLDRRKDLLYQQRNDTQDSLKKYRSYGIVSTVHQIERLTEQYGIALAANNLSGADRIKRELNTLAQFSGNHDVLLRKSYEIEEELALIEFEFDRVAIDTEYILENKFVINRAYPADKKSYPVRWFIVFSSLLSVTIFSILSMVVFESLSSIK